MSNLKKDLLFIEFLEQMEQQKQGIKRFYNTLFDDIFHNTEKKHKAYEVALKHARVIEAAGYVKAAQDLRHILKGIYIQDEKE